MYTRWIKFGRSFDLGRMTLRELWRAYMTHPAVHIYILALAVCVAAVIRQHTPFLHALCAAAASFVAYPLAWYAIHRFILHSQYLYRSPLTAGLWKRIHFDHHQDPHRMDVLFGSPATTLPTIVGLLLPLGYVVGRGWGGAAAAVGTGMAITCIYEFCHCIQHLNVKPRSRLLLRMKQLHMAHHFHDEVGNYGITSFLVDRAFGTYYASTRERKRSAHVFNLGYDVAQAQRFPWVADLSGGPPRDHPPRAGKTA